MTIIVAAKRNLSPTLFPGSITAAFLELAKRVLSDDSSKHRIVQAEESDHWVHLQQPELVQAELDRLVDDGCTTEPSIIPLLPPLIHDPNQDPAVMLDILLSSPLWL